MGMRRKCSVCGNTGHNSRTCSVSGNIKTVKLLGVELAKSLPEQPTKNRRRGRKGVTWSQEEHALFLMGLQRLGRGDWRGISRNFVTSRTSTQVASHAQKFFIRQTKKKKATPMAVKEEGAAGDEKEILIRELKLFDEIPSHFGRNKKDSVSLELTLSTNNFFY